MQTKDYSAGGRVTLSGELSLRKELWVDECLRVERRTVGVVLDEGLKQSHAEFKRRYSLGCSDCTFPSLMQSPFPHLPV